MRARSSIAGLALVAAVACSTTRHGAPASRLELREKHEVYRVKPGDTAFSIAKSHGVTLEALVELNELDRPDRLVAGEELLIPGPKRPPSGESPVIPDVDPAPLVEAPADTVLDCGAPARPELTASELGFAWPVDGVVVAKFGTIEGMPHEGLDIAAPEGTPVRAARKGRVLFAGEQPGYGNLVIVAHEDDLVTIYANNARNCVEVGADVERGDVVALVGKGRRRGTPRLYFELRADKRPVDPKRYLPK